MGEGAILGDRERFSYLHFVGRQATPTGTNARGIWATPESGHPAYDSTSFEAGLTGTRVPEKQITKKYDWPERSIPQPASSWPEYLLAFPARDRLYYKQSDTWAVRYLSRLYSAEGEQDPLGAYLRARGELLEPLVPWAIPLEAAQDNKRRRTDDRRSKKRDASSAVGA